MKTLVALNNGKHVMKGRPEYEAPEEFLLEMLLKKKQETGAYPTANQLMTDECMPTQGSYAYYFKTYENACLEADFYEKKKQGIKPKAAVKAKYVGLTAK